MKEIGIGLSGAMWMKCDGVGIKGVEKKRKRMKRKKIYG